MRRLPRVTDTPIVVPLLMAALAASSCTPDGRIDASSRTPACKSELVAAMSRFAQEEGLDLSPGIKDAQSIIDNGTVSLRYARDGVRYANFFGIEFEDGSCALEFYKRKISKPGESSTDWAGWGTIVLKQCTCQ